MRKTFNFQMDEGVILWLSPVNKYILVKPPIDQIIKMVWESNEFDSAVEFCKSNMELEREEAVIVVSNIEEQLSGLKIDSGKEEPGKQLSFAFQQISTANQITYKINDTLFSVEYETPEAQELIHPKFSSFKLGGYSKADHQLRVLHSKNGFSLWVNNKHIGSWKRTEGHLLGGKVSMQILQKLYNNEEDDWIGVFHAAAVSTGDRCLMFLGDSGNGKSTLSALLMANGLDVLADDFLPIENSENLICRFPSAISVKKQALDLLTPIYPGLKSSEEHYNPSLNKTFRYLPQSKTTKTAVPCEALVFVKYQKDIGFECNKMDKNEAFQKLVCDSWLSPIESNVRKFVNWFQQLPCYKLTYSDNDRMIAFVKERLANE